jgi:hypothetical protein
MEAEKHGNTLGVVDRLQAKCDAVQAILDCAKVLTALERAKATEQEGTLATGEGYADGHVLADASLPALLAHGYFLMRDIQGDVETLHTAAHHA